MKQQAHPCVIRVSFLLPPHTIVASRLPVLHFFTQRYRKATINAGGGAHTEWPSVLVSMQTPLRAVRSVDTDTAERPSVLGGV